MSREIEFRGYDLENRCWRYGYYQKRKEMTLSGWNLSQDKIDANTKHYIIWDGFSDWNMTKPCYRADVQPESIGQYTNLLDMNKKRVYESDILRWKDWREELREVPDIYIMEWDKEVGRFYLQCWRDGKRITDTDLSDRIYGETNPLYDMEVVGNRYDNLKVKPNETDKDDF